MVLLCNREQPGKLAFCSSIFTRPDFVTPSDFSKELGAAGHCCRDRRKRSSKTPPASLPSHLLLGCVLKGFLSLGTASCGRETPRSPPGRFQQLQLPASHIDPS